MAFGQHRQRVLNDDRHKRAIRQWLAFDAFCTRQAARIERTLWSGGARRLDQIRLRKLSTQADRERLQHTGNVELRGVASHTMGDRRHAQD